MLRNKTHKTPQKMKTQHKAHRRVNRMNNAIAPHATAARSMSITPTHRSPRPARQAMDAIIDERMAEIHAQGTYKTELVITSPQQAHVQVEGRGEMLNFCANNYLGLSNHPRITKAAHAAIDSHGAGLSSVRFICGTQDIHKNLENQISKFLGTADTILFPSAFDANEGIFEALLTKDDALICDQLVHASIINGVRLCKAERHIYKHMDLKHLEEILKNTQDKRQRLIVTDGVFSMDGHIADLKAICDLADKYNALTFVDDAHATGVIPAANGKGSIHACGVEGRVDIINSTLGKALGGASGGFTTSPSKKLIDFLRNTARPSLFSNSIAPPVAGAAAEAISIVESGDEQLLKKLHSNTAHFLKGIKAAGFTIPATHPGHPIVPVMLGDAKLAKDFADTMKFKHNIFCTPIAYPIVEKGKARIRVQISAGHSTEDLDRCIEAFKLTRDELQPQGAQ